MWLTRVRRQSITAQITLIVSVSVLLGIVLTVTILLLFFGRAASRASPSAAAARIASVAQMAHAAREPAELETIIEAARRAGIEVQQVPLADVHAELNGRPVPRLLRIARELEATWGIGVIDPGSRVAINFDAQTALLFEVEPQVQVWRLFAAPLALMLTIVLIAVGSLSLYAMRWIIAPLSTLAAAADSSGHVPEKARIAAARGPREVAQVADALTQMQVRLRTLLDDRTRMLGAISHDLRAPLTRLRLRAERAPSEIRAGMMQDLKRIGRMLDETLQYLRQDLRSEPLERVDLAALLQTICAEFSDVGHDVTYTGAMRLPQACRPNALSRAIANLIDNAVKYGTSVKVHLTPLESGARIDIADDGPGIAPAMRERVFEPFFKIESAEAPERSGFGLGLSIARDAVRGHGGTIELLDAEPHGLLVRLWLPAAPIPIGSEPSVDNPPTNHLLAGSG